MEFNLADMFENAVDAFGDRDCVVAEGKRSTYAQMEARANRLAHHLASHGIEPGDHVGIYAYNSVEWVETLWAVFKIRAVWININYRYVEDELRYLFDNADLKALIYAREFGPRIAAVRDSLPFLQHAIVLEDGSGAEAPALDSIDFEAAVAEGSPERDFAPRSADDRYIIYTGGTTGLPKGVVWRHEDVFFALGGGNDPATGVRAAHPGIMVERDAGPATFLPIAPLMHGATQWSVMGGALVGRKNVLVAKFDPPEIWRLVEAEKVNGIMITGDAMGRPMIEALHEGGPTRDLSSFSVLVSSAAIFSPTVKDDFFRYFPNLIITDSIGASESGNNGMVIVTKGNSAMLGGGPTVKAGPGTTVLNDDLEPVIPGDGVVGKLARSGDIPIEYYKDPEKSAQTFVTKGSQRYSIPGDFARMEADGTITLLGRGSVSINSGGEKIYPEEVEAAIKSHSDAYDAVVVGVPDDRWGSRVAAVVQPREGSTLSLDSIQEHCRKHIAGYKVPRELHIVAEICRSPSGKPDYRWAKAIATGEASYSP
ncbi:MAG: acyl-CoA synthetase [bacterium]|nr:acyl-CoA synthetase [bacterium]